MTSPVVLAALKLGNASAATIADRADRAGLDRHDVINNLRYLERTGRVARVILPVPIRGTRIHWRLIEPGEVPPTPPATASREPQRTEATRVERKPLPTRPTRTRAFGDPKYSMRGVIP